MEDMNTDMTWRTSSDSLETTEALGASLGQRLRGSEVIELTSDLGGGKTAFVRGLARGMGSQDTVASPSFTISREYQAGSLTLYHFDFYRLNSPGIMANELAELLTDPQAVIAVEWGQLIEDVLPAKRLRIDIKASGDNQRQFTIIYPAELAYLIPKDQNHDTDH